jgi:hypothetical protein
VQSPSQGLHVGKIRNPKLGAGSGQPASIARRTDDGGNRFGREGLAEGVDNAMAREAGRADDRYHWTASVSRDA